MMDNFIKFSGGLSFMISRLSLISNKYVLFWSVKKRVTNYSGVNDHK